VVPQINAGDTVKLDIRQEVSSVAGTVGGRNSADLILNKREIETSIVVDNGDIIGIGGLLNDNERRTIEKIPLLGDLPVVGNLFKSRGRARDKTNLMVFIRPTILRSAADARAMTNRRYGYIRDRQYLQNPNQEPSLDELVREYMGAPRRCRRPGDRRGAADPAGRPGREPDPDPAAAGEEAVTDPRSDIAQPAAELPLPVNIPYGSPSASASLCSAKKRAASSSRCARAAIRAL
jgi:general secretion pathway protein D